MSRGLRLLSAAAVACASLTLFGVPAAHADTADIVPSNSGYFYQGGVDKPEESPATIPNPGDTTDGVGATHLAVAAKGGTEDKVSFLYFDMFNLPLDATIDQAIVKLVLIPNTPPTDISYQASADNVIACMAGDSGFSGDEAVGIAKAPDRLCDKFKAPAKLSSDGKAYEFDITSLANSWLTGANDGVAFTRSDSAPSSNFQVVFDSPSTASMKVSYTAPEVEAPEVPVVDVPGTTTGGVVTPPSDGGTGGFAPSPGTGLGGDPGIVPTAPEAGVPPVVPPQTGGSTPVRTVALSTSMRPTNAFWLGGVVLVIALVIVSLVCGDPRVAASHRTSSRLTKALSARQSLVTRPASW